MGYEKVLKQYQELSVTISKIQDKQKKLIQIYKEYQFSSEFELSYEIDTSIFQIELVMNMQQNALVAIQDLEAKKSNMKKLKLIFFDLENNISLCCKTINDKDL